MLISKTHWPCKNLFWSLSTDKSLELSVATMKGRLGENTHVYSFLITVLYAHSNARNCLFMPCIINSDQ